MRIVEIISECGNHEVVYGVSVADKNGVTSYCKLTCSKEKIKQLKRNLEDSDISAVHIPDIIKDFIAEEACDKLIANSML